MTPASTRCMSGPALNTHFDQRSVCDGKTRRNRDQTWSLVSLRVNILRFVSFASFVCRCHSLTPLPIASSDGFGSNLMLPEETGAPGCFHIRLGRQRIYFIELPGERRSVEGARFAEPRHFVAMSAQELLFSPCFGDFRGRIQGTGFSAGAGCMTGYEALLARGHASAQVSEALRLSNNDPGLAEEVLLAWKKCPPPQFEVAKPPAPPYRASSRTGDHGADKRKVAGPEVRRSPVARPGGRHRSPAIAAAQHGHPSKRERGDCIAGFNPAPSRAYMGAAWFHCLDCM